MSRPLKIDESIISAFLEKVRQKLASRKWNDGKIEVVEKLADLNEEAYLWFTTEAWAKMDALTQEYDTEVEWHGTVRRLSSDTFLIDDILVFPHECGASTVTSDQTEYEKWLDSLDIDVFNKLRLHGHSHVRMGVSPSPFDMDYRDRLVSSLPAPSATEDIFYIFFIFNKNRAWTAEIYDVSNNIAYSSADKDIKIGVCLHDGTSLTDFITHAKTIATTRKVVTGKTENKRDDKPESKWAKDYNKDQSTFDEICERLRRENPYGLE